MLITHDRERLINAIVYFAKNTNHCGITKLMKLLFLLDFEHFKLTGRSVTGQGYYAYPMGPVPGEIHDELTNDFDDDLALAVTIVPERIYQHERLTVKAKIDFDASLFSNRELRLLDRISSEYKDHQSKQMVDVTHAENGVWDQVYAKGAGNRAPIPYELSLPEADMPDLMLAKYKEFNALNSHFGKTTSSTH